MIMEWYNGERHGVTFSPNLTQNMKDVYGWNVDVTIRELIEHLATGTLLV